MIQPNPLKIRIFDPLPTQSNPTQPMGQPNSWTTLCQITPLVQSCLLSSEILASMPPQIQMWPPEAAAAQNAPE